MKSKHILLLVILLLSNYLTAQTLQIDSEKAIVNYHFVKEKVEGTISGMKASITFNTNDLSKSKIEGTVDVSTLTSGNGLRDKHLKSKSYFDADQYPTLKFVSEEIKKNDEGFLMTGYISLKDQRKKVSIQFSYENNVFTGKSEIYTNDFDFFNKKKREDSMVLLTFIVPLMD